MASPDTPSSSSRQALWWWFVGLAVVAVVALLVARWGDDEGAHAEEIEEIETVEPEGELAEVGPRSPPSESTPQLRQGHRVTGVFVDPESGPLTEGRVEFWCEDGRPIGRARVDEDGRFSGPGCAERTCVRLTHPAFDQPGPWLIDHGPEIELEVASALRVVGVISSFEGAPVADASLTLQHEDGRRAAARTDVDGSFALALPGLRPCDPCDLNPGPPRCAIAAAASGRDRAQMLVMAPGFAPTEIDVQLGVGEPLELTLAHPAAAISGVVRGADGAPFDARTKILATNVAREAERHHAAVDEHGAFELRGLADARYDLRAIRDGRELASVEGVEPGQTITLTAPVPARGASLRLELVDEVGVPFAGVRVDGGPFSGQRSDAEGELEVSAVLAGRYELRLRAGGCPVVRSVVEVAEGAKLADAQIELASACRPQADP